jgi:mRNA interferase MazF
MGNSRGVIIPKPVLEQVGLTDETEMSIENGAIVLRKPAQCVRAGWATAAQRIAAADLDPTVGSEIRKSRPCAIVSPSEMNDHLRTVIVSPMTTASQPAPFRVGISHRGKRGLVLLDQLRPIDKTRLVRRSGAASAATSAGLLRTLRELFAE